METSDQAKTEGAGESNTIAAAAMAKLAKNMPPVSEPGTFEHRDVNPGTGNRTPTNEPKNQMRSNPADDSGRGV